MPHTPKSMPPTSDEHVKLKAFMWPLTASEKRKGENSDKSNTDIHRTYDSGQQRKGTTLISQT